jgi:hypothetical protein
MRKQFISIASDDSIAFETIIWTVPSPFTTLSAIQFLSSYSYPKGNKFLLNSAASVLFSLDSTKKIITKYQLNSIEPRINLISTITLQNSFKLTDIYFDENQTNLIAYGEELIRMSVNPDLS